MRRVSDFIRYVLGKIFTKAGYAVVSLETVAKRQSKLESAVENLKLVDGVKVLSMRVWTEGENPCAHHVYSKAKMPNSHKSAAGMSKGEHSDFMCPTCTHMMCATKWGEDV